MSVACGQCIGCRLERSRQWAIRCYHEAQMWEENCFVTLTYAPEHLPPDRSLHLDHFQKFMKRLRKKTGGGVRFFHCGEYGEQFGRPHYHAILFNVAFGDQKLWKVQNEFPLYTSEALSRLWPLGFSSVGAATFQSAAYVARYILKKVTGAQSASHYEWTDPETGEVHQRKPEYVTMSRRPGIGRTWLDKYGGSDCWRHDEVVIDGRAMRPPRYYDDVLKVEHPSEFEATKRRRVAASLAHADNNTPERLEVREKVQQAKLTRLKRTVE